MSVRYSYVLPARDPEQLRDEVAAAAVPGVLDVQLSKSDESRVWLVFANALTAPQVAALDAVVATHVPDPAVAAARDPNRAALRDQAAQFVADINDYLLIADTATQVQVRAAVKRLAQATKVIILRLNELN